MSPSKGTGTISLLVATKDRSNFMARLLHYYADVGFQGRIMIGDSSGEEHLDGTLRTVESLSSKLDIVHHHYPGLWNTEASNELLRQVETEYSAFLPDDDFLCASGLEECATFLDSNADYASAHGLGVMFSLKNGSSWGEIAGVYHYAQGTLENQTGHQRFKDLFSNYFVTMFSVHRTETARHIYQGEPGVAEWSFCCELLPNALSAVYGKAKELDCLYLIRQHHDQRYALPDTFDWMTNPDWSSSYQAFLSRLVEVLVDHDGITREEAAGVVKSSFIAYIKGRMDQECWNGIPLSTKLKSTARSVPGVRTVRNAARTLLPKRPETISMDDLLKPSSKYHQDFMPIYRAITTPVEAPVS